LPLLAAERAGHATSDPWSVPRVVVTLT
jgi:hypothetical protein